MNKNVISSLRSTALGRPGSALGAKNGYVPSGWGIEIPHFNQLPPHMVIIGTYLIFMFPLRQSDDQTPAIARHSVVHGKWLPRVKRAP